MALSNVPPEDHLRVCGADPLGHCRQSPPSGSSPRVRSRPGRERLPARHPGIISACAEQTPGTGCVEAPGRDHLRVCGADPSNSSRNHAGSGSSPRVRSRLVGLALRVGVEGIISACAEQTTLVRRQGRMRQDHLRVCGADDAAAAIATVNAGSSPRVRSRQQPQRGVNAVARIISACAEQTSVVAWGADRDEDHLRVCGADYSRRPRYSSSGGSSPRVRSRHPALAFHRCR